MIELAVILGQTQAPALSSPGHEAIEQLPAFGWAFVKMLLVLGGIIVALLLASRLLAGRLGQRRMFGRSRLIEVVDVVRIEPRKSVYLLKVAGQYYLVGTSDGSIHTLAGEPLAPGAVEAALSELGRGDGRDSTVAKPGVGSGGNRPRGSFIEMLQSVRQRKS